MKERLTDMAGKTGEVIDYSLRVQKNVERKILGDVIRSLSYFDKVEKYRYIGFGSFYYKDFLLLHEKYNIHSGISIEIDNRFFATRSDILHRHVTYLNLILSKYSDVLKNWFLKNNSTQMVLTCQNLEKVAEFLAQSISNWYVGKIVDCEKIFTGMQVSAKGIYDYTGIRKDVISQKDLFVDEVKKFINTLFSVSDCVSDNVDELMAEIPLPDDTLFVISEYEQYVKEGFVNRYLYNKPYGFISVVFKELLNAYESINWNEDYKNIIWLDYDCFLSEEQLFGLEKSVLNSGRGDLIVFSTSMGDKTDKERCDSLNVIRESSGKIVDEVLLKDCYDKGIPKVMHKIVTDLVKAAIAKKNNNRPEGTPEFAYQPVVECVYKDGMPMYTYGFVIYNSNDNIDDEYFPGNVLSNNIWFPDDEEIYDIYVPALTHKEVNAINQLLPSKTDEEIAEKFPFISLKCIRKYKEIWRYYPNYLEVDGYV